jgi:hypothetical protein
MDVQKQKDLLEAAYLGPREHRQAARDQLFDPTYPLIVECDAEEFRTGDPAKAVTLGCKRIDEREADLQLWIAKGRPPMPPGWRDR